jgi:hypothetical protein
MSSTTQAPVHLSRRTLRRRRTVALLAALALIAGLIWAKVVYDAADTDALVQCPHPTAADTGWHPMSYDGLDTVRPVPANTVRVRVLNAGTQHGSAVRTDGELQRLGFVSAAQPGDDPAYPTGTMTCVGEIRFGAAGQAAARTLSLAVPCTQLIRDDRHDDTVDLAVGTGFSDVTPKPAARQVLQQLAVWSRQHPQPAGGLQSHEESAPHLDDGLLADARSTVC